MPVIPCNPGKFHCRYASWRPTGKLRFNGSPFQRDNPVERYTKQGAKRKSLAARMFVGFNVKNKPTWKVSDVEKIVASVREKQTGDPSASFISQRGIYQHQDGKRLVREDSAQVIIIDTHGTPIKKFVSQVLDLAEQVAQKLKQETVIVEIQRNGITYDMYGVHP